MVQAVTCPQPRDPARKSHSQMEHSGSFETTARQTDWGSPARNGNSLPAPLQRFGFVTVM